MTNTIADTGFIVARWETPARKRWAERWWKESRLPVLTTAANLHEAGFLLGNHEVVLRMVRDGDLRVALDVQEEIERLHALTLKYINRKMDLADAGIVRLSELHPGHMVLTVDREDFSVYRSEDGKPVPCDFGPLV
jgi:predicted nucleic acid-binding protein